MIIRFVALLVATLLLIGCTKNLTEEETYHELQQSIKYRTYTKASEAGLLPALSQINKVNEKLAEEKMVTEKLYQDLSAEEAHTGLALLWVLGLKPDFAIAESNIALRILTDNKEKYRAYSILALAMYQKGWKVLAAKQSEVAKGVLNDPNLANELYSEQLTTYLAYGLLSLKQGDIEGVRVSFSALGALTGITWLSEVTESVLLIRQGRFQDGLSRLKKVSDDPALPEAERVYIKKIIDAVENEVGDIDGEFFVVKVLGKIVFERILETDDGPFRKFVEKLEKFKSSFGGSDA